MEVALLLLLTGTVLALLAMSVVVRKSYARTTRRLITVLDRYTDRETARQERRPMRSR